MAKNVRTVNSYMLERIKKLESSLPNSDSSPTKRFLAIGGIAALVFTLINGGFSALEVLYLNRQRLAEDRRSELGGIVARFAEMNVNVLDQQYAIGDVTDPERQRQLAQKVWTYTTIVMSERNALLTRAVDIIDSLGDEASAFALTQISYEFLQLGNTDLAISYAQRLIALGRNDPEIAEAYRMIAKSQFYKFDTDFLVSSRASYRAALAFLMPLETPQLAAQAQVTFMDWHWSLVSIGNCDEARLVLEDAREALAGVTPSPMASLDGLNQMASLTYSSQTRLRTYKPA